MPTYEYACRSCGSHLEVVQAFSDEPLTECPTCGGALRKVFGSIGIAFKGSGFYRTDSRAASTTSRRGDGDKAEKSTGDGDKADKGAKKAEKAGDKASSSSSKESTAKSA